MHSTLQPFPRKLSPRGCSRYASVGDPGTPSTKDGATWSPVDLSSCSSKSPRGRSSSPVSTLDVDSEASSPTRRSGSRHEVAVLGGLQQTPRCRHQSFRTLGSHVSWRTLLEFAGETPKAWVDRKVHRWLGVDEAGALALLEELLDLRRALGEEKQYRETQGCVSFSFLGWLFGDAEPELERRPPPVQHKETVRYNFDDIETLGLLGHGGFGSVSLVWCHVTKQVLAMKSVSKGSLAALHLEQTASVERDVMRACSSPFLLKLAASFNRGDCIYFLMEAALGGDLYTTYQRERLFGNEVHARFYTACVMCAFQHLHERKIIYRDLKMENVVLDSRGYGKLCDFGTSTFRFSGTSTMCGTPEYMAPEILTGLHNCAVDWWSLGVLIHELMLACTPFMSEDTLELFEQVKAGMDSKKLPGTIWSDLVLRLCKQDPCLRLPMLPGGIDNVKAHPWFAESYFCWHDFENRGQPAPFTPKLSGPTDTRNFSPQDQALPEAFAYQEKNEEWAQEFELVIGPKHVA